MRFGLILLVALAGLLSGCGDDRSPDANGMLVQTRTFPANSPEMAEVLAGIDRLCSSGQDTFRESCLFSVVPSIDATQVTVTWVGPDDSP